ncbi:MAG: YihY family inner membrane protein [Campylobacterales bacterium]|nr:YihY family inner membrane protein [Campylobacterales bacterium]
MFKLKNFSLSYKIIRTYFLSLLDRELTYYASSLSFYTLFTLAPVMLIVLSISTSLSSFDAFYGNIKAFIMDNILPVSSEAFSNFIDTFMQNSMQLSIIGIVSVIISSMLFFQNFEYIVNKIFKTKPRGFWQSLTIYWTLITLTPIALVFSFYLSKEFQVLLGAHEYTKALNVLDLFPYLVIWSLFFLIYKISANIEISNRAAGISSFAVSLAWYLAKVGFVSYVLHNQSYATLYGSFSTLIFFFLWIYLSWIIFIYGLKLCYTIEKVGQESEAEEAQKREDEAAEDSRETQKEIRKKNPKRDQELDDGDLQS